MFEILMTWLSVGRVCYDFFFLPTLSFSCLVEYGRQGHQEKLGLFRACRWHYDITAFLLTSSEHIKIIKYQEVTRYIAAVSKLMKLHDCQPASFKSLKMYQVQCLAAVQCSEWMSYKVWVMYWVMQSNCFSREFGCGFSQLRLAIGKSKLEAIV